MTLQADSSWASHGGTLSVHTHDSSVCQCPMTFGIFVPPQAAAAPVPVVWYLSGLTCSWANVMEKSGLQRAASELGLIVVAPDTSPRGENIANDEAYDLGQGAGFYLTATQHPWAPHFAMDRYITEELPALLAESFPVDMKKQGITGHSMGGHGALTLHLKHPDTYRSVSAFSPIVSPTSVPWGQKAFTHYLGSNESDWQQYDATSLVRQSASTAKLLIDTGDADQFFDEQLDPSDFLKACSDSGQAVEYRKQPGYDHSYYFVASFIADHLAHHSAVLNS